MAPQPGMFPVPAHKSRTNNVVEDASYGYVAGPSKTSEESKKDRRRKETAGRLGKEMSERRDEQTTAAQNIFADSIQLFRHAAHTLSTRPDMSGAFNLRLYPLSLERSALLAQLAVEERHARAVVETAYEEERARVDAEWKKGRERVRDRLLEGIEERRKRAREEKDGDGTLGADPAIDSQSRPHITRKLRNKLATPPPPVLPFPPAPTGGGGATTLNTTLPGPLTNPLSLAVDELPSPFPLPLTATSSSGGANGGGGASASVAPNGRRRAKGGGGPREAVGGLGKSLAALAQCKESEVDSDLGDIRRGNKRRRRP